MYYQGSIINKERPEVISCNRIANRKERNHKKKKRQATKCFM